MRGGKRRDTGNPWRSSRSSALSWTRPGERGLAPPLRRRIARDGITVGMHERHLRDLARMTSADEIDEQTVLVHGKVRSLRTSASWGLPESPLAKPMCRRTEPERGCCVRGREGRRSTRSECVRRGAGEDGEERLHANLECASGGVCGLVPVSRASDMRPLAHCGFRESDHCRRIKIRAVTRTA